jgi:hypothetical protein
MHLELDQPGCKGEHGWSLIRNGECNWQWNPKILSHKYVLCLIGYRRLREYQTKMSEHIDLQKIGMARVEFSS